MKKYEIKFRYTHNNKNGNPAGEHAFSRYYSSLKKAKAEVRESYEYADVEFRGFNKRSSCYTVIGVIEGYKSRASSIPTAIIVHKVH